MKNYKILTISTFILLLVAACAPAPQEKPKDDGNNINPDVNESEKPSEEEVNDNSSSDSSEDSITNKYYNPDYKVTYDEFEIYDKFVSENDGVQVTEFELSLNNLGYIYKIEGMTKDEEIEAEYAAESGELVDLERDSYDSEKTFIAREDLEQMISFLDLTFEDAKEEYYLKEFTLKNENGRKLVEVEVIDNNRNEIEYKYDFATKELLEKDQ